MGIVWGWVWCVGAPDGKHARYGRDVARVAPIGEDGGVIGHDWLFGGSGDWAGRV